MKLVFCGGFLFGFLFELCAHSRSRGPRFDRAPPCPSPARNEWRGERNVGLSDRSFGPVDRRPPRSSPAEGEENGRLCAPVLSLTCASQDRHDRSFSPGLHCTVLSFCIGIRYLARSVEQRIIKKRARRAILPKSSVSHRRNVKS